MKITISDIAKEAGVSIATVSHVINGTKNISEKRRKKILEIIKRHNYVPNSAAINLRTNKTNTIALIISSFLDDYIIKLMEGVSNRAREENYNLLFINTNEDSDYEKEIIHLLQSGEVDGIILSSASIELESLKDYRSSIPIVLLNRTASDNTKYPVISGNDFQVGYKATKHLLEQGHEQIGFIYGIPNVSPTLNRIKGYKAALKEYGIPYDESLLEWGKATKEGSIEATKTLIEKNPSITALFVQKDLMTIGTIIALREMNLRIPQDVALIGFGDFSSAEIIEPPITVITMPAKKIGEKACETLIEKINKQDHNLSVEFPCSLIIRKSCGHK